MPSGSMRISSSSPPGRSVGLMQPTTPRQLVNAIAISYASLVSSEIICRQERPQIELFLYAFESDHVTIASDLPHPATKTLFYCT